MHTQACAGVAGLEPKLENRAAGARFRAVVNSSARQRGEVVGWCI